MTDSCVYVGFILLLDFCKKRLDDKQKLNGLNGCYVPGHTCWKVDYLS